MIRTGTGVLMAAPARLAARLGIHYGWVVVAVTFLAITISAGIRTAPSVMMLPMESEFHWDRIDISLGLSLNVLLFGLAGPFSGRLVERFGLRKVMVASFSLMALGCLGAMTMVVLFQFYLFWGVVVGLGTGGVAVVMAAVVANRWFASRRGLITGLLAAGSSAGQLVLIPILMQITVEYGWRSATLLLAAIIAALILPLLLILMRNDPKDVGLSPYGAGAMTPASIAADNRVTPFTTALRTTDFWLLASTFFACGFTANGTVGTHLIPHAVESGFTEMVAAGAVALMGVMNVVGTLAAGYFCDRVDRRKLLAAIYALRALALVSLPYIGGGNTLGLSVFAIIFGLDFVATVPPTSTLAADLWGRRSVGVIFGWIAFSHQVGAALAATLNGWMRVAEGDYHHAFLLAAMVSLMSAALCLKLPTIRKVKLLPRGA
ncbi:MAG: MFS transporter [Chloroflexi bacterium]|nr:MFS transporter [Chloroflexota bacterium]